MLDSNGNVIVSPLDSLFAKGLQVVNPPHQYECLMPDGTRQRVDAFVVDSLVDGRVSLVPCQIADDPRFMEPIVGYEKVIDSTIEARKEQAEFFRRGMAAMQNLKDLPVASFPEFLPGSPLEAKA